MRPIALRGMKVAHWASQSDNDDKTLDWDNLLGACEGGNGGPRDQMHCDTAQDNTPIKLHPADRAQRCERLVRYFSDGRVASDDQELQKDLDETLKLNYLPLKTARKQILDVMLSRLERQGGKGAPWPRALYEPRGSPRWKQRDAEQKLPEYCQVAIYYLQKKLPAGRARPHGPRIGCGSHGGAGGALGLSHPRGTRRRRARALRGASR